MYTYHFNPDNMFSQSFTDCENFIDPALRVPSISELVREARQTGNVPYSCLRTPVPSYTEDIDSDSSKYFASPDRCGDALNERAFRANIEQTERALAKTRDELAKRAQSGTPPEQSADSENSPQ